MNKQYAYKFQLRPIQKKATAMARMAGCCRLVWNKALSLQKERLEKKEKLLSYVQLASLLVGWKKDLLFLQEAPSQSLQQTLKNLDRALRDGLRKTNPKQFPRYKKKSMHDSFLYPQGYKLDQDNARIYLPKIGFVRYKKSRLVEGTLKNVTVSKHCHKWYAALQVEIDEPEKVHTSTTVLAIDVGIATFAMCSDGTEIKPLNSFRKHERRLAFLQRRLSRKEKYSKNWNRQKNTVSKCHAKISNCRKDFLHKITTTISKNHAVVVLEDLKVSQMSKSAKGTVESPGKNVKAKAGLNKSILDQGWHEFRRQLDYKLRWLGGKLLLIRPEYTSKQCSECGCLDNGNRKSQALFECVACGYKDNADFNAAKNIRAAGLAVLGCGGDDLSHPMKQQPTVLRSIAS